MDDSVFTVQVGALELFAPIRVARDGDSSRATESSGGPQSATDSIGTVQVASVQPDAPVRVVSDGDDASSGSGSGVGSGGAGQTTQGSIATVQIGSGGTATVADVPPGQDTGDDVLPSGSGTTPGGGQSAPKSRRDPKSQRARRRGRVAPHLRSSWPGTRIRTEPA